MTLDVAMRCRCGGVVGVARAVSPSTANRGVCYCHDCRAYLHWLDREDLLDAHGGTEVVQIARARLEITKGLPDVKLVLLAPKGLHRWYAGCCRTPIANTVPWLPFVGIARATLEVESERSESIFGPSSPAWPQSAVGGRAPGPLVSVRGLAHVTRLLARWTWSGLGHPTPLFDRENRPTALPIVLSGEERQRLRDHPRA
jgi:hypothetical protein